MAGVPRLLQICAKLQRPNVRIIRAGEAQWEHPIRPLYLHGEEEASFLEQEGMGELRWWFNGDNKAGAEVHWWRLFALL